MRGPAAARDMIAVGHYPSGLTYEGTAFKRSQGNYAVKCDIYAFLQPPE